MACSICTYLECALASRRTEYIAACTGVLRQFTSELEAYRVVEMERARSELQMHRSVCLSACLSAVAAAIAPLPIKALELHPADGPIHRNADPGPPGVLSLVV